jgi:glycosyltransferase involved in cell wall biosynthesis
MGEATFLVADNDQELNTSWFRILAPQKYLSKAGHGIVLQSVQSFDVRQVKETVLLERLIFPDTIKLLQLAGAKRIVGTFDDAYHVMPDVSGSKAYWTKDRLDLFREGLGMCDLVLVPSTKLVTEYSKFGNMKLMPNYIDDELWPLVEMPPRDIVILGWGGSLGHGVTWNKTNLLEALRTLKKKYARKIEILICGKIPPAIADSDLPCSYMGNWTPYPQWPEVVHAFHVGLAPLAGAYDRFRSGLKIEEYGLAQIPFVASDDGEYKIIHETETTGGIFVKDRVQDWVDALSSLIDDPSLREGNGRIAREWAEGYFMSKHVEDYEDVLFS